MGFQAFVLGDMGLVVGSPRESVVADLADERFYSQVNLGVLPEI